MKITRVSTELLSVPWTSDPGWRLGDRNVAAFITVDTDEGVRGTGETILGHFAPQVVLPLVDYFRPLLIGEDPSRIEYLWQKMFQNSIWWGRVGAGLSVISGIDIALWDLKGNVLGVPVHQLLGGPVHEQVLVYASSGEGLWPPERTVEKVQRYAEMGYRAAKVGTMAASDPYYQYDPKTSVAKYSYPPTARSAQMESEKFAALRRALGPDFELAIDGHQGAHPRPSTTGEAIRTAQALEPYGLLLFEEPLAYDNIEGYAELRRRTHVPIAGGESLSGVSDFAAYIRADALDIVQPDVSHVGGITAAAKVLTLAEAHHLRSAIHTGGAVGPGFAASLHLAVAHPGTLVLERVQAAAGAQAELIADPLDMLEGKLAAPRAPGLGTRLTADYIAAHPYIPGSGVRN